MATMPVNGIRESSENPWREALAKEGNSTASQGAKRTVIPTRESSFRAQRGISLGFPRYIDA